MLLEDFIAEARKGLTPEQNEAFVEGTYLNMATVLRDELATAIKLARKHEGLTQQELAGVTGIPQSELSRLEQCKANPTLETIAKLYVVLGIRHTVRFKNLAPESDNLDNDKRTHPTL
jgi:ribosome-binding protein aMBF1 (putative translation factor)